MASWRKQRENEQGEGPAGRAAALHFIPQEQAVCGAKLGFLEPHWPVSLGVCGGRVAVGEQTPVAQFGGGGAPRPRQRWQGVEGS